MATTPAIFHLYTDRIECKGATYNMREDLRKEHGAVWTGKNKGPKMWVISLTPSCDVEAIRRSIDAICARTGSGVPSHWEDYRDGAGECWDVETLPEDPTPDHDDSGAAESVPTESADKAESKREPFQIPPVRPNDGKPVKASEGSFEALFAELVARYSGNGSIDEDRVREIVKEAVAELDRPRRVELVIPNTESRTTDKPAHKTFPVLLQALAAGLHVWIAGPSGSGKTHAAEQVAELLGLSFELQGAMTMAHELIGFVDAGGNYHETPFVRAYTGGGLILLDEIDAGSNEALLALNAALANGVMSLPTGEVVRAHTDFRCIGSANTYGQGATHDYVGRTRIDAAFLQRFGARIQWDYDEELEKMLCGNDVWFERVVRARRKAAEAGLKVLITPRASFAGARLLAAGMSYEQAAELTYLAGLTPDQRNLLK